jgi:lipoprotein NlpI
LIERGQTYIAEGKRALGRKDFEKVLAEDSNYPGPREHLAQFQD